MPKALNIGILGTGNIAHTMAGAINYLEKTDGTVRLYAVASREAEKARQFGESFGAEKVYGDYASLCADASVDIAYIATPHGRHFEDADMALDAGRSVLCEKAFTLNSAQAEKLIAKSRGKGLFLCEAMWSRFFPVTQKVGEWLADGEIGEVRAVHADNGFRARPDFTSRLLDLNLGGGALLDIGIYPLSFISYVYGGIEPAKVSAYSHFFHNGADSLTSALLDYGGGHAGFSCSLTAPMRSEGIVYGERGSISVRDSIVAPTKAVLNIDGAEDVFEYPHEFNGYEYELRAVVKAMAAGKGECPEMPLDETLSIMRTIDRIKADCGLKYQQDGAVN